MWDRGRVGYKVSADTLERLARLYSSETLSTILDELVALQTHAFLHFRSRRRSLSRKNSTPSMPPSRSTSVSSVAAAAAAPGTPDGKGSTAGESATYAVPLPPATAAVSANPGAADSAASGTARGYITFSAPSTSAAATEGINAPSRSKLPLGDILLKVCCVRSASDVCTRFGIMDSDAGEKRGRAHLERHARPPLDCLPTCLMPIALASAPGLGLASFSHSVLIGGCCCLVLAHCLHNADPILRLHAAGMGLGQG